MTREEAHKLVDVLFDEEHSTSAPAGEVIAVDGEGNVVEEPKRELPEGKRMVRTKTSGDTVYFLDEAKKTRQRILGSQKHPGPELVESLGFGMDDVVEVDDTELFKYAMGQVIYEPAKDASA